MNSYVWKEHFKFEDWRVAFEYLIPGGYMFKFDISSAYHHIDIHSSHQTFLGFSWEGKFYVFSVLPFGLTSAPFVWTKCLRSVVKFVRENGIYLVLFLDDGWGVNRSFSLTEENAKFVKDVLQNAGFLINLTRKMNTNANA